jgi:lipoprotein-anchoring transpeptidase ErfK/SrfK
MRLTRRTAHRAAGLSAAGALSLSLLVTSPVGATQAAPADVTATVTSASPTAFTLTRLETGAVDVSIHLVVPAGQRTGYRDHGLRLPLPAVVTGDRRRDLPRTELRLVSGTPADGVWSATIPVGAVNDGLRTLAVEVCPASQVCNGGSPVVVDLAVDIDVTGSDWPVLTGVSQVPSRLEPGQTRGASAVGQAVFSDTRAPAAGVGVVVQRTPGTHGSLQDTTGTGGRFRAAWPWPKDNPARLMLVTKIAGPGRVVHDRTRLGVPATAFALTTGKSDAVIRSGTRWSVSGTVTPGVAPGRLGPVLLERRTPNGWRTVDRAALEPIMRAGEPTSTARFSLAHRFADNGGLVLRVHKPAALCGGKRCRVTGAAERIVVVVGSPTYLVERKLRALGVPVGTVDGVADARTYQALCAWRDLTGRTPSRDGLRPTLTRSIMSAHRLPRPGRSDGIYVNKTCQMLFQVVDHTYRRVVWASTGKPKFDTPVGTGAVFRKLKGPIESTLYPEAYMYDPMFFLTSRPGIALHGSASNSLVLPYPASHGCIRVWRPAIHRIFDETPLGTKVQVYGTY